MCQRSAPRSAPCLEQLPHGFSEDIFAHRSDRGLWNTAPRSLPGAEAKGTTRDDCISKGKAKSLSLGGAGRGSPEGESSMSLRKWESFDANGRIAMIETMIKKRSCLFCGNACNSREHVIPEWLSKTMKIRDFAFQPAHFTEGKGLELRPSIKCAGFRTRQVCAKCNNGWMSNLEGWAKGRIGNAVARICPWFDERTGTLGR